MAILQVHSFAELNHLAEAAVLKTLGINDLDFDWDSRSSTGSTSKDSKDSNSEGQDPSERNLELLNSLKPKPPTKSKIYGLPPPPKPPSILMAKLMKIGQQIRIDLVAKSAHKAFETAKEYFERQDLERAYLLLLRCCILLLEVCPKLSVWCKPEHTSLRLDSRRVSIKALDLLETIHPLLKKRFDEFQLKEKLISQRIAEQRQFSESLRAEEQEYYLSKKLEQKRLKEEAELKSPDEEKSESHVDEEGDESHKPTSEEYMNLEDQEQSLDANDYVNDREEENEIHGEASFLENRTSRGFSGGSETSTMGYEMNPSLVGVSGFESFDSGTDASIKQAHQEHEEISQASKRRRSILSPKLDDVTVKDLRVSFSPTVAVKEYVVNPEEYPSIDGSEEEEGEEGDDDDNEWEFYEDEIEEDQLEPYDEDAGEEHAEEEKHPKEVSDEDTEDFDREDEEFEEGTEETADEELEEDIEETVDEEFEEDQDSSMIEEETTTYQESKMDHEELNSHRNDKNPDPYISTKDQSNSLSYDLNSSEESREFPKNSNQHDQMELFHDTNANITSTSLNSRPNDIYSSTSFLDPDKYD